MDRRICYAPIDGLFSMPEDALDISPDCKVLKLPTWISNSEFIDNMVENSITTKLINSSFVLEYSYPAEAEDPKPQPMDMELDVENKLSLLSLSGWLIGFNNFRPQGFFHFRVDGDQKVLKTCSSTGNIFNHYENKYFSSDKIELLTTTWHNLKTIEKTSAFWIAIWTLYKSFLESSQPIKIIMLWIALEALFGAPNSNGELSHQLCERIALFLKGANSDGHSLYSKLKKSYGIRSKVVHGDSLKLKDLDIDIKDLEEVIQEALMKVLNQDSLLKKFISNDNREQYLKSLVFGECNS